MTMLMNRLNNIEDTINSKEQLIEQLRNDISNLQQQVHAVRGVSELAENLKALTLQTWMSIYSVCPEEEELILAELEQARMDAKSKVEAGIPQLVENIADENEEAIEAVAVEVNEVEEPTIEKVIEEIIDEALPESEVLPENKVLSEADLNALDFPLLKKFAVAMGVMARKRENINKEMLNKGVIQEDLDKFLSSQ